MLIEQKTESGSSATQRKVGSPNGACFNGSRGDSDCIFFGRRSYAQLETQLAQLQWGVGPAGNNEARMSLSVFVSTVELRDEIETNAFAFTTQNDFQGQSRGRRARLGLIGKKNALVTNPSRLNHKKETYRGAARYRTWLGQEVVRNGKGRNLVVNLPDPTSNRTEAPSPVKKVVKSAL